MEIMFPFFSLFAVNMGWITNSIRRLYSENKDVMLSTIKGLLLTSILITEKTFPLNFLSYIRILIDSVFFSMNVRESSTTLLATSLSEDSAYIFNPLPATSFHCSYKASFITAYKNYQNLPFFAIEFLLRRI